MTISPNVHILTGTDLEAIKNASFQRGVRRGQLDSQIETPIDTAMSMIEAACSLFWGRNGDMSHMDTDQFREAHFKWYEQARKFIEEVKAAKAADTAKVET